MSYIEVSHETKRYQSGETEILANNDVNFTVEKGELVVILGSSGAGKSSLLNILGGMDTTSEGSVVIDGNDIAQYNSHQLTDYRRTDVGFFSSSITWSRTSRPRRTSSSLPRS